MQNPFTLTFGKSPMVPTERPVQTNEIIDAFTAEPVNQQVFILTGVRDSGKTRGYVTFTLPLFREYAITHSWLYTRPRRFGKSPNDIGCAP